MYLCQSGFVFYFILFYFILFFGFYKSWFLFWPIHLRGFFAVYVCFLLYIYISFFSFYSFFMGGGGACPLLKEGEKSWKSRYYHNSTCLCLSVCLVMFCSVSTKQQQHFTKQLDQECGTFLMKLFSGETSKLLLCLLVGMCPCLSLCLFFIFFVLFYFILHF